MKLLLRSATCILSDNIKGKPADYAHVELRCQCWGGECSGRSESKKRTAVC